MRFLVLVGGLLAAAGSAGQNRSQSQASTAPQAPVDETPPEGRPMDANLAIGLWKSSFGPVKIEHDYEGGDGHLMGVWVYDREGEQVVGYFDGNLDGNVLRFAWFEPAEPAELRGSGYLVFDPNGNAFNGKWWTDGKDRNGDWSGWRTPDTAPRRPGADEAPTGDGADSQGQGDGPAEQAGAPPDNDYM